MNIQFFNILSVPILGQTVLPIPIQTSLKNHDKRWRFPCSLIIFSEDTFPVNTRDNCSESSPNFFFFFEIVQI
ncbi:hypothetical protein CH354_17450 [Leptospira levettii]|nr:hypothetical protein CH354_17450 [Leptospira levettii]PJZ88101.1 hypothetical protein CH368_13440 [Leptospira levettii]PJZ99514.1 hypothetical protein CH369_15150 [Leptospira levettii]